MFQTIVSLCLLPCLLLGPTLTVGHSHSDGQPPGHDLRPHFHTRGTSSKHDHRHHDHHSHGKRHGARRGGSHRGGQVDRQGEMQVPLTCSVHHNPADHDSNAIYLDSVGPMLIVRSEFADIARTSVGLGFISLTTLAEIDAYCLDRRATNHDVPNRIGMPCPLYIQHLAMLI